MAFKLKDVLAIRSNVAAACAAASTADRLLLLAALIDAGDQAKDYSEAQITAAFARVLWIKHELHQNLKEGKDLLAKAEGTLAMLAASNRLLAFLARDVSIFLGNLYASYGHYEDALTAYRAAIDGEFNKDRRALGLLNIARTYVSMGEFYRALGAAEHCKLPGLEDASMRSYFLLLKARLLLILGYREQGALTLQLLPEAATGKIALEARYLRLVAAAATTSPTAAKTEYEQLIAWVDGEGDEASVHFYRLEWQAFAPLLEDIANKRTYLDKARYLARLVQREDLYDLASATVKVALSDKISDDDYAALRQAQERLLVYAEHLLYQQHLMQTAEHLLVRRHFDKAAVLIDDLEGFLRKQKADLPPALAAKLASSPNWVMGRIADLRAAIPATISQKTAEIGAFLGE